MGYKLMNDVNIPPAGRGKRNRTSKYPFAKMVVGDYFVVNNEEGKPANRRMGPVVNWANKRYAPLHFLIRKCEDGSGCRIWRDI